MTRKLSATALFCFAVSALTLLVTPARRAAADDPFGHPGLSWDEVPGSNWCGQPKDGEVVQPCACDDAGHCMVAGKCTRWDMTYNKTNWYSAKAFTKDLKDYGGCAPAFVGPSECEALNTLLCATLTIYSKEECEGTSTTRSLYVRGACKLK